MVNSLKEITIHIIYHFYKMSSLVKKIHTQKKVAHKKARCLSKNIFTKRGECVPQAPFTTVFMRVLCLSYGNSKKPPFNMETQKRDLPDRTVRHRKVTLFKKVYTNVVMYKLVEAHILYIKNRKCQIM